MIDRAREIQAEIGYISTYLKSISPKLSKYAELQKKRRELYKKLKQLKDENSGDKTEAKEKAHAE